jgi:hypothetical protein
MLCWVISRKNSTSPMSSASTMSSALVGLLVIHFCLIKDTYASIFPTYIMTSVCHLETSCSMKALTMYDHPLVGPCIHSISIHSVLPLKYPSTLSIFFYSVQSRFLLWYTKTYKNQMSDVSLLAKYSILASFCLVCTFYPSAVRLYYFISHQFKRKFLNFDEKYLPPSSTPSN